MFAAPIRNINILEHISKLETLKIFGDQITNAKVPSDFLILPLVSLECVKVIF